MALYLILGAAFIALYFVIRSGAKAEAVADIAQTQLKEISDEVKTANKINAATDLPDDLLLPPDQRGK